MRKNQFINIIKLFSSIVIMLNHLGMGLHCWGSVDVINYVLVDSFFIISGFLFAYNLEKNQKYSLCAYMRKKIGGIYFLYILALILCLIVALIRGQLIIDRQITIESIILEAVMAQQLFKPCNLMNGPDWYVSAWIISLFIYMMSFKLLRKYSYLLAKILFGSYVVYFFYSGYVSNVDKPLGIIMGGTYRALSVMGLGILGYKVILYFRNIYNSNGKKLNVLLLILISGYLFCIRYCTEYAFLSMGANLLMLCLVGMSFLCVSFSGHLLEKICDFKLGDISIFIYLFHMPAKFIHYYLLNSIGSNCGLVITVVIVILGARFLDSKEKAFFEGMRKNKC